MFETEIPNPPSIFAFVLQQFAVCFGWLMWGLLSISFIAPLGASRNPLACGVEAVAIFLFAIIPAVPIGWKMQQSAPDLANRWIWVLPSLAMVLLLIFGGPLQEGIRDFFFPRQQGISGIGAAFATFPTLGCIGYSLGITAGRRSSAKVPVITATTTPSR